MNFLFDLYKKNGILELKHLPVLTAHYLSEFLREPIAAFWNFYLTGKVEVHIRFQWRVRATRALLCSCLNHILNLVYGFITFVLALMQRVVRLRILRQNASQTRCSRLKSTAMPRLLSRRHILSLIKIHYNITMHIFHQMIFIVRSAYF